MVNSQKKLITLYRGFKVSYVGPHERGTAGDTVGPTVRIEDTHNRLTKVVPYRHELGDHVDTAANYLRSRKIKICGTVVISKKHQLLLTKDFDINLK
jgi:hypothetical protein